MRFLIDMNLSPEWVDVFRRHGWEARHWSDGHDPRATDAHIMAWARSNDCIVFTHDLDFGMLLAATGADGPSVIQVRSQDVMPARMEQVVVRAIRQFERELRMGAVVVVEPWRSRARVLPLR